MWKRIKWWYLINTKAGKCKCCLFCKHFKDCVNDNAYLFKKEGDDNG